MAKVFVHIKLYCEITCSDMVYASIVLYVDVNYRVAVVDAPAPPLSLVFGNHGNPPRSALKVIGEISYIHTFLTSLFKLNSPLSSLAWISLSF